MFTILSISDSDKHFDPVIKEYQKRLGKSLQIENIKPFKDSNQAFVIKKETENLIQHIQKKYTNLTKVLLSKSGAQLDTLQLSSSLHGKEVLFIIGGPYGLDEELLSTTFSGLKKLSFGAITLPHGLAKLTLVEQLYRVSTLRQGKSYHY